MGQGQGGGAAQRLRRIALKGDLSYGSGGLIRAPRGSCRSVAVGGRENQPSDRVTKCVVLNSFWYTQMHKATREPKGTQTWVIPSCSSALVRNTGFVDPDCPICVLSL